MPDSQSREHYFTEEHGRMPDSQSREHYFTEERGRMPDSQPIEHYFTEEPVECTGLSTDRALLY